MYFNQLKELSKNTDTSLHINLFKHIGKAETHTGQYMTNCDHLQYYLLDHLLSTVET